MRSLKINMSTRATLHEQERIVKTYQIGAAAHAKVTVGLLGSKQSAPDATYVPEEPTQCIVCPLA